MIRRPPRSTLSSSSAASDVYKRQTLLPNGVAGPLYKIGSPSLLFSYATIIASLVVPVNCSPLSIRARVFASVAVISVPAIAPSLNASEDMTIIFMVPNDDGFVSPAVTKTVTHASLRIRTVSYTHLRAHETPEHL